MSPQIMIVLIEYSESDQRVMVRGVWDEEAAPSLPPLHEDNQQNCVKVFKGIDMKKNVGFSGLLPSN